MSGECLPPDKQKELNMGRSILLWLLGVPISAIIVMHLFGVL